MSAGSFCGQLFRNREKFAKFVSLENSRLPFMDIDLLSKMVYDLILEHDRVALPGVGCFVAETVPASFSDRGYTINPPYRKLSFRSRPDDGELLVRLYSKSNAVSEEDARAILTDFLSEMKSVLFTRKVIVFPGLGRLRATRENNLFFVADETLDICPDGFGLQPLSLKTRRESGQEIADKVSELDGILNSGVPEAETSHDEVSGAETAAGEMPTELQPEAVTQPAVPEAGPQPVADVQPQPDSPAEPASSEVSAEENVPQSPEKSGLRISLTVLGVLLLATALFFVAFMLTAHFCPDFLDRLLYSAEELEIINYKL